MVGRTEGEMNRAGRYRPSEIEREMVRGTKLER